MVEVESEGREGREYHEGGSVAEAEFLVELSPPILKIGPREKMLAVEQEVDASKGRAYTQGKDPLQNFREQSLLEGRPMASVVLTFLLKHVIALKNAVQRAEAGEKVALELFDAEGHEGLLSRGIDVRIYVLLLMECLQADQQ